MKSVVLPVESTGVLEARRERVIAAMEREFARAPLRRRQQMRRRWGYRVGMALAAAVALGFGYKAVVERAQEQNAPGLLLSTTEPPEGSRSVRLTGGTEKGEVEQALKLGERITTALGVEGEIVLSEGARLILREGSSLRLKKAAELEDEVELEQGHVDVDVPLLEGRVRHLVVWTPTASVWVTGTQFAVEVKPALDDRAGLTTVRVSRGSVRVVAGEREARVSAGERWSSSEPELGSARKAFEEPTVDQPAATAEKIIPKPAARTEPASSVAHENRPSLARENKSFLAALAARNRGDDVQAVKLYDEFLARYPRSELVQEVKAERLRAIERLGRRGTVP
jgi:hypothetical protein